ncbi:MAG TPA: hypothetical protein VKD91_11695 [Pyrinomonadaceae bacterium]|nr:hypothetical protein [Pyrinomonadaceae bacterium]
MVLIWLIAGATHYLWFANSFQPEATYEDGRAWPTMVFIIYWLPDWMVALLALTVVWTILVVFHHRKLQSNVD